MKNSRMKLRLHFARVPRSGYPGKEFQADHDGMQTEKPPIKAASRMSVGLSIITNGDGDLCPSRNDDRDRHDPCGRADVHGPNQQE